MSRQADITAETRALASGKTREVAAASRRWLANETLPSLRCCLMYWISPCGSPSSQICRLRGGMNSLAGTTRMNTMAAIGTNRSMRAPAPASTRSVTRSGLPRKRAAGSGDAESNTQEHALCTAPWITSALPASSRKIRCVRNESQDTTVRSDRGPSWMASTGHPWKKADRSSISLSLDCTRTVNAHGDAAAIKKSRVRVAGQCAAADCRCSLPRPRRLVLIGVSPNNFR